MSKQVKPSERALEQARLLAIHYNAIAPSHGVDARESRMDANETNMLALALEQMRARVYEAQYPELKARRFIPVSGEVDTGAETFAYEETDYAGQAKVIRNYADDVPTVETKSSKTTHTILSLGDGFIYSIQDIRRAAFSGQPLNARKAMAARRVWERGLDGIAALGAPDDGIPTGLLNKVVGSGAGQIRGTAMTSADWKNATFSPTGVIDDLNTAIQEMITDSEEHFTPNLLLLTTALYLKMAHSRMSADNAETVLEAFLRANPYIEDVQPWNLLKAIDAGGNGARGMLLRRDPEVLELVIPQEFEVLPPQPKNFAFQVLAHGRTAGTCVYRPLGCRYLTALPNDPAV